MCVVLTLSINLTLSLTWISQTFIARYCGKLTISVAIIYRKLPEPYLLQHCWIICFTSNIPARCYASLTLQLIFSRHTVPGSVFESENNALDHKILFFYLFRNLKTLASLSFSRHFDCLSRADPWHQEISGVHKVGFSKFVHSVMPGECVHKPCELKSWTAKFVWNSILRWSEVIDKFLSRLKFRILIVLSFLSDITRFKKLLFYCLIAWTDERFWSEIIFSFHI